MSGVFSRIIGTSPISDSLADLKRIRERAYHQVKNSGKDQHTIKHLLNEIDRAYTNSLAMLETDEKGLSKREYRAKKGDIADQKVLEEFKRTFQEGKKMAVARFQAKVKEILGTA